MHRTRRQAFTLTELLVTLILISLAGWLADDLIGNRIIGERRAAGVCPGNLHGIGDAVKRYKAEHGGKYPPRAAELSSYIDRADLSYHRADKGQTYICHFTGKVKKGDIVCWDDRPHGAPYRIFKGKNRPYRNVPYANGLTGTLSEQQFQRLGLVGETIASR